MAGTDRVLRADARRNRERLLEAARAVFAEQGVEAPLEEVARRAGVSVGTIYHRFGGRLALVDAALAGHVEESIALVRRCLEDPDPWRGLVGYLTEITAWQLGDRGFTEICVYVLPPETATERAKTRGHEVVAQLVGRAHDAGVLRTDVGLTDVGLLSWAVVAAHRGLAGTAPDAWRRHLALLLDGLRPEAAHPLPGAPLDPQAVREAMSYDPGSTRSAGRARQSQSSPSTGSTRGT